MIVSMTFLLLKLFFIFVLLLILWFNADSIAQQLCVDFLMPDVCRSYVRWNRCNRYEALLSCRKTCGVCLPGWSTWSMYGTCSSSCFGTQTRSRNCRGLPSDCPGLSTQVQPCNTICTIVIFSSVSGGGGTATVLITASTTPSRNFVMQGTSQLLPTGISRGATVGPGGKDISSILCNGTYFKCEETTSTNIICVPLTVVCDGFDDCPSSSDENPSNCFASANSANVFQIKNEFKQVCLEVITNDPQGPINGVRAYQICPTIYNPQWSKFAWRWWRSFHLLNVYTGRCLEAQSPNLAITPELTSKLCDDANLNQKFICQNQLKIRLKFKPLNSPNFYLSLGDSNNGWPVLLQDDSSNLNRLWQLGSFQTSKSICSTQVYWSDWSSWSDCSHTCQGGQRNHSRTCVNGAIGVAPCIGNTFEIGPCNQLISCLTGVTSTTQNSQCFSTFTQLNNAYSSISSVPLDPTCYFLNSVALPFKQAKKHCQSENGFLAMIKENSAKILSSILITNINVSTKAYIGIEENIFLPPVQGHYLRFSFDDSPVGHEKPWFTDCVLGPGYDYIGTMDITISGLQCQRWNSDFPHKVNFKPLGDDNHNYCRNPNFDPKGPWCYTMSNKLVRDYCLIPQCFDTSSITQMNENAEFRLAISCDNLLTDDSLYSFVFSVSDQLFLQACAPKKNENWENVPASEKFVWDSSRSRIINLGNLYCLEASNTNLPTFEAVLRPCAPSKITQTWSAVNNRIKLTYSMSDSDFQLDTSPTGRTVLVNTREQNAWTASRSGYFDDLALLQDAGRSFHIYSITDGLCLGTAEDVNQPGQLVVTNLKDERSLGLFPCQQLPNLRWIRYLSTSQTFFNVYSGLCLTPTSHTVGATVILRRCDGLSSLVQWDCSSNMQVLFVGANQLFLTVVNGNVVINPHSSETTKWAVGERNSQPICSSPVPEGNVPAGGSFALRNGFRSDLCVQADEFGNVFTQKCTEFGSTSGSSLVWSFTDSPTMLIQYQVRRCLSVVSTRTGAAVMTRVCDVRDSRQQWLLSKQPISSQHPDINTPFYNIHLAVNKKLVVSIDPVTGRLLLRTANAQNFVAFNRFSHLTSVQTMSDCYISQGSNIYYSGSISTTKTGKQCLSWTESEKILYPELDANYCRNPGNLTLKPWCFITSSVGAKTTEECIVPKCVSRKVVVDSAGLWHPVDGAKPHPFICQAEPECYRGNGNSYMGRFNITSSGPCLAWTSTSITSPILQKNYCRNPTNTSGAPFCFVNPTTQVTCSNLPQCEQVCLSISPKLAKAMVARLKYSGSGYGIETGTTTTVQCLPGYWVNDITNRIDAECVLGQWFPLSAGCTRMRCSTVPPSAPRANLTVLGRHFGDITALTCFPGLLAGPMAPVLKYVCNSLGNWERLGDPNAECSSPCDVGMVPFRGGCYGVSTATASFDEALQASRALAGTLADLNDATDFDFLRDLVLNHANLSYGADSLYWLGIKHFSLTPQSNDPLWRDWRSINVLNEAEVMEMKGAGYLPFIRNTFRIRHYLHGRFISNPNNIIPYESRCMYVDEKQSYVGARSCFDYPEETMLWSWISPFHLYHIASGKCLTGFAADSFSPSDLHLQATATDCDVTNTMQYVGCRRYSDHASLKLLLHENSFFVDTLQDSWDRIHMGGGAYAGNFSHWIINETNFDVCHHSVTYKGKAYLLWEGVAASGTSYTFDQAVERCAKDGATVASESSVYDSLTSEEVSSCACAWIEGGIAVSVMRIGDPLCPISLPLGGIVNCPGTITVADVWCYKGTNLNPPYVPWVVALFLESSDNFGVIQKNALDKFRFIVRKESRWRCPNPPPADRSRLLESPSTSYSYLGITAYQCDPGYWYERDVFSKVIFCSANLQWEPTPGTFACVGLYCPTPVDIPFADKTVESVSYLGTATYQCKKGLWFGNFRFKIEIRCSEHGDWLPPVSSLFCNLITCDSPPEVKFARFEVASLNYQSTASYECHPGYWFRPRVFKTVVTCGPEALWVPDPKGLICWEVICPPLADYSSNIWKPKTRKLLDLSCEKGFYLSGYDISFGTFKVEGNQIEFECSNKGIWLPNPNFFYCARELLHEIKLSHSLKNEPITDAQCTRPPDVASAEHTGYHSSVEFDYGSKLSYYCIPGSSIYYMFALYNKAYNLCLHQGTGGVVYATEAACSTSDMTFLQWGDSASADGFLPLIDSRTKLCLTATFTPSVAGRVNGVQFIPCSAMNMRQYWFCNQYGVSNLILGVGNPNQLYLSVDLDTGIVYVTPNILEGVDFISFYDRSSDVDFDVCRYQRPRPEQPVVCLADGSWLPNPNLIQCISIYCPPPPVPPFATMQSDTVDGGYGSYVTYTCQDGYAFVGGSLQFVVRCSESGSWVPDPLEYPCTRASCPRYVIPSGATITVGDIDDNLFGSVLMIACPLGYIFRDNITSVTVKCQANGQWEESELVNDCLPISCGRPTTVDHASVTATGSFVYNTLARYLCDPGYRFDVGRTYDDVYCNAEGLWEPEPSSLHCSVVDCPRPVEIKNAAMYVQGRTQNGLYIFGAVAFYQCQNGMEFFDGIIKRTVTCRDDGKWHPDPQSLFCSEMACPPLHDLMPRNAYVIGHDYSFGGNIEFRCEAGYVVELDDGTTAEFVTSTCSAFRRWIPNPLKLLCARRPCSSLPAVPFARPTMNDGLFGSQVQYTCLPGYHVRPGVGGYVTTCNSNGTWDPNPFSFTCEPINCGHPGVYEHSLPVRLINSTTRFGMFATVECQEGYWFDGIFQKHATIQCSVQGLWHPPPEDFRCVDVLCSDPGEVKFATKSILPPDVPENVTSVDPITKGLFYKFGVRLNYSCGLIRAVVRTQRHLIVSCTSSGTWSVDLSTVSCSLITCSSPLSIAFAFVTLNSAFTHGQYYVGSTLQYSCFEGYWFRKDVYSKRAVCQNNGRWNITPTENCIRISCPPPPVMANGVFLFSISSYPRAGRYHCNPGYLIRNNPVLVCSLLGQWVPDPSSLSCDPLPCPRPPTVVNAMTVSLPPTFSFQSRVTFQCMRGFRFRSGVDLADIVCEGDGTWSGADIACLPSDKIECLFPPFAPNSYYVSRSARTIVLTCHPGFIISSPAGLSTEQLRFCTDDGFWTPPAATCQTTICSIPTVNNGWTISSPTPILPTQGFRIGEKINVTCDRGSAFPFSPTSRTFTSTVTFTCQLNAEWFPDISSYFCEEVFCPVPPDKDNAVLRYSRIDYGAVAIYRCLEPNSFEGFMFRLITCTIDGQWLPDPYGFQCSVQRCKIPNPPPFSVLSMENRLLTPGNTFQRLRVTCSTGYTIKEIFSNMMSKVFDCEINGEWKPYDPADTNCTAVECSPPGGAVQPNFQISSAASQTSYPYGSSLTFSCSGGFWLSPGNLMFIVSRCLRNGTWEPRPIAFRCVVVTCFYPPILPLSTLRLYAPVSLNGNGLEYGSIWRYSCLPGYRVASGETFSDIQCGGFGRWFPETDQNLCRPPPCSIPPFLPNVVNTFLFLLGDLDPNQYPNQLRSGNNFTYQCLEGYWMSNGTMKMRETNLTCVRGTWVPDPRSLPRCVPVVCDMPLQVIGARSDGIARVYNSQVAYTCAASQHFRSFKLRRVVSFCNGTGLWEPDPRSLVCTDVYCDDFEIPGTNKFGSSLKGGSSLIFSCPPGMRFSPETTQLATTCNDDGVWDPDISMRSCEDITCGVPLIKNAIVLNPIYDIGSVIQLECLSGFNLLPETSDRLFITCGRSGTWSPNPRNYKCQGRQCSRPSQIKNGLIISESEDRVRDSIQVRCNPGYFIMRGVTEVNATCLPDTTWSKGISSIECIPLTCLPLIDLVGASAHQVSSIPPPQYNSEVRFECNKGLGFEEGVLFKVVRCGEKGFWEPSINFKCTVLRCSSPPVKRNSIIEGQLLKSGDYPVAHNLTYRCTNFSWLSAQYAIAEWAFVGVFETEVVCRDHGNWTPSPDSFACRPIHEGPLPTGYDRGLSFDQVESEMWLRDDEYLAGNLENHPYVTAVKTGYSRWVKGGDLPFSVVREGGPALSGARFAWDGDLVSGWVPRLNVPRRFNMTIYLGKQLQIVEAVAVFSGASEFERIDHLIVRFSPDGKRFDDSVSTVPTSRQLTESEAVLFDVSSRTSVSGFSFPAKFLQIIVLQTSGLEFPPIIYEIRVFCADARWEVRILYDFLLILFFFAGWLAYFASGFYYSQKHDKLDLWKVQFAPPSVSANKLSNNLCYVVNIKLNNPKEVKYLFCRVLFSSTKSAIFIINSQFESERIQLYIPTSFNYPPILQLAFLDRRLKDASDAPLLSTIKIGVIKFSDSLIENVPWIHKSEIILYSGKPDFVVFSELSKQKLADVLDGKKKPTKKIVEKFRQALKNHLFLSVFTRTVVSQISRMDYLFISSVGFFSALVSTLLVSMAIAQGCFLLTLFCSVLGFCVAVLLKVWILAQPLYGLKSPPAFDDKDAHPLLELMDSAQIFDNQAFSQREGEHDGVRALNLVGEFEKTEKQKVWMKRPSLDQKIAEVFHSSLLPENYRHPPPVFSRFESGSMTSLDLETAFRKRWGSTRRRTRSAPTILVPKRDFGLFVKQKPKPTDSITSALKTDEESKILEDSKIPEESKIDKDSKSDKDSKTDLTYSYAPSIIVTKTEYDTSGRKTLEDTTTIFTPLTSPVPTRIRVRKRRLSCASLWTEESLAEDWHRVHTSLNETAFFQESPSPKKKKLSGLVWVDPTYRRIPSKHLIREARFPKTTSLLTNQKQTSDYSSSVTSRVPQPEEIHPSSNVAETSSFPSDSFPLTTDLSTQEEKPSDYSPTPESEDLPELVDTHPPAETTYEVMDNIYENPELPKLVSQKVDSDQVLEINDTLLHPPQDGIQSNQETELSSVTPMTDHESHVELDDRLPVEPIAPEVSDLTDLDLSTELPELVSQEVNLLKPDSDQSNLTSEVLETKDTLAHPQDGVQFTQETTETVTYESHVELDDRLPIEPIVPEISDVTDLDLSSELPELVSQEVNLLSPDSDQNNFESKVLETKDTLLHPQDWIQSKKETKLSSATPMTGHERHVELDDRLLVKPIAPDISDVTDLDLSSELPELVSQEVNVIKPDFHQTNFVSEVFETKDTSAHPQDGIQSTQETTENVTYESHVELDDRLPVESIVPEISGVTDSDQSIELPKIVIPDVDSSKPDSDRRSFDSEILEIKGDLSQTQSLIVESGNDDDNKPRFFSAPNVSRGTRPLYRRLSFDVTRNGLQSDCTGRLSGAGQLDTNRQSHRSSTSDTIKTQEDTSSFKPGNFVALRKKKKPLRRKDRMRSISLIPARSSSGSSYSLIGDVAIDSSSLDGVSSSGLLLASRFLNRSGSFSTLLDETRSEETLLQDHIRKEKPSSDLTSLLRERFIDELVSSDSSASRRFYCIAPSARGLYSSDFVDDGEFEDALEYQVHEREAHCKNISLQQECEVELIDQTKSQATEDFLPGLNKNDTKAHKSDSLQRLLSEDSSIKDFSSHFSLVDAKASKEELIDFCDDPSTAIHPSALTGDEQKQAPRGPEELTQVVSTHPAAVFYQFSQERRLQSKILTLIVFCFIPVIAYFGLRGVDQREHTICLFSLTAFVYFAFMLIEALFRKDILACFAVKEELSLPLLYRSDAKHNFQ